MTSRDKTSRVARIGRWLRLHGLRSLRENSTPARTALGVALGAFIGIFPTFLVGAPLAFFVAGRFKLNRAAAVAGAVISMNPITAPILYPLSAWLGVELLDREHIEKGATGLLQSITEYGGAFLLGNTIVALTVALIFSAVIFVLVSRKGGLRALVLKPRYRPVATRSRREPTDVRPAA
ncbi:MAG: DUF2062 domain-containing protein [Bryobacterales bacterium]